MQGFTYLSGVVTLRYDPDLCNGCRRCIDVCPHQVFDMQEKRARIVLEDACMECGACSLNCEPGALSVNSGVGCAAGLLVEWWREVTGNKNAGACC